MAEKKYYKIGEIVNQEKKIAIPDDLGQGYGFKDEKAFVEKKGICYIPEHAFSDMCGESFECDECKEGEERFDDGFTYQDFYNLAKKFVEENEVSCDCTIEGIAQDLFDTVDWQYPSTLMNDYEMGGYCED